MSQRTNRFNRFRRSGNPTTHPSIPKCKPKTPESEPDACIAIGEALGENHSEPKHAWTSIEKRVLLVLVRYFRLQWHELPDVMNEIFVKNTTKTPFRKDPCRSYFQTMQNRDGRASWTSFARFYKEIYQENPIRPSTPVIRLIDEL
jgi:hypothetical protein